MRESSEHVDFTPHEKRHRVTLSQHSNTLSDISCDTQASDIPESEHSETETTGEVTDNRLVGSAVPRHSQSVQSKDYLAREGTFPVKFNLQAHSRTPLNLL